MRRRFLTVPLALAVTACSGSPTEPMPDVPDADAGPAPVFDIVVDDPAFPDLLRYTFDDLTESCVPFTQTSGLYEDLVFPSPVFLVPCMTDNGTIGLRPSSFLGGSVEVRVQLPAPASAVSIESFLFDAGDAPTLIAYDASGVEIGRASDGTPNEWATLAVEAAGATIAEIGLSMPQLVVDLDNLTVDYGAGAPEPDPDPDPDPTDPSVRSDCLGYGWAVFGFRNQGQCVRFVETGMDSR